LWKTKRQASDLFLYPKSEKFTRIPPRISSFFSSLFYGDRAAKFPKIIVISVLIRHNPYPGRPQGNPRLYFSAFSTSINSSATRQLLGGRHLRGGFAHFNLVTDFLNFRILLLNMGNQSFGQNPAYAASTIAGAVSRDFNLLTAKVTRTLPLR
jgi:hypothetical protein